MPLTPAERQASYRKRQKAKAGEGIEQAVERARQAQIDEYAKQVEEDAQASGHQADADELTMLAAYRARPARTGEAFELWLAQLVWDDIDSELFHYRKEWKRAQRKTRPRPKRRELPPY